MTMTMMMTMTMTVGTIATAPNLRRCIDHGAQTKARG
jgi:hypothetical protein